MPVQPTHNLSLAELDRRSFLHPFTPLADHLENGPRVIVEGEGAWLRDLDGQRYFDAMAGLWCVDIGYGRPEVVEAIYQQARKLSYYHAFSSMATEPSIRLADRLIRLAPEGISKVFFGNSGSDANDTNVKLIWYYNNLRGKPDKVKIISRRNGYHGVTVAAASLSGLPLLHEAWHLPIPEAKHTACPDLYRGKPDGMAELDYSQQLAAELEALIEREGPDTVGAFIAEPVMGAGGVVVPPEGYFQAIQAVLDRHDVLMIADEVICGFGRLGHWFGSDRYGIRPDLMTIAKGLTSGYVPMSASLIGDKVWQVIVDHSREIGPFGHGYTYTAHPVGAAAAMANLDIIEGEGLVDNARTVGAPFQRRMREAFGDHPLVGHVRGEGLIMGIEMVADRASKQAFDPRHKVAARIVQCCLEEGVIVRSLPGGDVIALSPPLIVTADDVELIVGRFAKGLEKAAASLRAEGIWRG
jgi:L-2,4-diaminobutyrate transaminase